MEREAPVYDPNLTHLRAARLLEEVIRPSVYSDRRPLEVAVFQCSDPISYDEAIGREYKPVDLGFCWGPVWSTAWFRLRGRVPVEFGEEFRLLFDTRTEALCWWDGAPYQGVELHRQDVKLPSVVRAGDTIEVFIEAACNHMLGVGREYGDFARMGELSSTQSGTLTLAHVARHHPARAALLVEFELLLDLARDLPPDSPRARHVNEALRDAVASLRFDRIDETLPAVRARIAEALTTPNAGDATDAYCIGNAHIDLAWLWPIRETKRKASRTFSTVLRYMERHPEYCFLQSQAQLYEWVREKYPALFEQIRERVREGRWEAGGSTWVEPDCNIPSGESLVRQLLLGARYFQEHFGVRQSYLWQPDVFGYSAALPQILKLAELDVFFSQKISWNQYNKFPHHSFRWAGIDGTEVVSHFFPADTYIGTNLPTELRHGQKNYQQSARAPLWLQAYGWGDGGGGPTEAMIERVALQRDCAGVPRARHGRADQFARKLLEHADALPRWVGELYLELHRGTYTTHALVKKRNRLGERALQDLEIVQSLSIVNGGTRADEQRKETDRLWKLLLLNQFHDILPGSSIGWVYKDAHEDYGQVLGGARKMLEETLGAGAPDAGGELIVLNTSGRARGETITLPSGVNPRALRVSDSESIPTQEVTTLTGGRERIAFLPALPPLATIVVRAADEQPGEASTLAVGDLWIENEHLRAELDPSGRVVSLFDKRTGREAIQPGRPANQFVLYEDYPSNHDAWDVDLGYRDKPESVDSPAEHRIVERGPVRAAIEFARDLGRGSRLVQHVRLCGAGRFIEFVTRVTWKESHRFLRVLHPVDVHGDHATYEIQFGHLRRPNHFNTSWDYGRFEVPAQRWMDYSETDFGVTMINDCKYGHSCLGDVMGLSLLRSTKSPDPDADMGEHEFRYALMPHAAFDPSEAIAAAESFNQPPVVVPAAGKRSWEASVPFAELPSQSGVVIDTIKPAEDGDGLILRIYESRGGRTSFTMKLHPSIVSIEQVNLLERQARSVAFDARSHSLELSLRAFEIRTLRLRLK